MWRNVTAVCVSWLECVVIVVILQSCLTGVHKMIQEGDRVMVGLSGGKDSLTLLIALIHMQKYLPQKFDLAACTVDPQTEGTYVRGCVVVLMLTRLQAMIRLL